MMVLRPMAPMNEASDFVVAWDSLKSGSHYVVRHHEFQDRGRQSCSAVHHEPARRLPVRWSLPFALVSCIFAIGPSLAGVAPNGPELQVNTYTTDAQYSPAVAVNAAGNFVVIWSSYSQDGSQAGVFARRFDSGGLPAGGEFQANTFTTGYQGARSIAMNAAGGFVVS